MLLTKFFIKKDYCGHIEDVLCLLHRMMMMLMVAGWDVGWLVDKEGKDNIKISSSENQRRNCFKRSKGFRFLILKICKKRERKVVFEYEEKGNRENKLL
jgi:hypothetical protein